MNLLQSGVDLTVIKTWLGHVNLHITHAYVEIDLEMKNKALSSYEPASRIGNLKYLIKQNNNLINWLESL
jgi:integrase/recombinase XerD